MRPQHLPCRALLLGGLSTLLVLGSTPAPTLAQRVVNVSPEVNAPAVAPDASIVGQFDTSTGAVRAGSVVILVNGQNVTSQSTIAPTFFTYRPATPFTPGPVQVQVEFVGADGARRVASWQFQVQAPRPAVEISSVTHNATTPLGPNGVFLVTVNGTPGSQGTVMLVRDGQTVQSLTPQEVSPGVYVATLTVPANSAMAEGVVVARLRRQGQTSYGIAAQPAVFTTATTGSSSPTTTVNQPTTTPVATLAPTFLNPTPDSTVSGNSFTLRGRTRPGAAVAIQVTASTSVFGLASVTQPLLNTQVTANANGEFEVAVPLGLFTGRGTRYAVTATASLSGEQAMSQMNVTQR